MESLINKFEAFQVLDGITYSSVRGHSLLADILIPKTLTDSSLGPRPILINIHGGALVAGSRNFQPFWASWVLDWASRNQAIVVAPDYPLAPESKSPEIVSALKAFTTWLHDGSLQSALDAQSPVAGLQADLSRVVLVGESAGAWCALHMALAAPTDIRIRALVLRFGMLDLGDAATYATPRPVAGCVPGVDQEPPAGFFEAHVAAMKDGAVISEAGPERLPLALTAILKGYTYQALGDTQETFPLDVLRKAEGVTLPPKVWLLHGLDDRVVPLKDSEVTLAILKERCPGVDTRFDTRPGPHGFDGEFQIDGEDTFLKEGIAWIDEDWVDRK